MTKKYFGLLAALLLTTMAFGCHHGLMSEVRGSGNRQKQKREVPAFSAISTEGAFHIEVVAQKTPSLEIEGDDNILPLVDTNVSNNVLKIKSNHTYSAGEPVVIRISVPNLESFTANGAGKLEVADLKNDRFELDINGAPAISVSGETKLLDLNTSGAGTIFANKLRATKAVVESKGVSRIELHVLEQLDVTVTGPSTVVYTGQPVVNKTIIGPGSVEKRESTGS